MNKIKENFSLQILHRVLTVITPLITSPIISRAFGATVLGQYTATFAFVSYFTLFSMLGVENYGNRTIAAAQKDIEKRSKLFWNIYFVQFFSSVTALIAYFISVLFIDKQRIVLALIQSLWIFSYLVDINWFFFGMEQFKLTVIRSSIIRVATVILIVIFVRSPSDIYMYAIIMGGGALLGQLVLWRYLRKFVVFVMPSYSDIKPHILPILKLYVPIIAISIFRLMDKTMLDLFSNEEELGYYYSADKVINIPLGLVTAVSTVMLPRISNILHENGVVSIIKLLYKSSELTLCLVSAVSFGICAIAKEFVPLFFGSGYEPVTQLIYVFVPVLIIKALEDIVCSQYIIPAHKDNLYIVALFSGAISNVISNFFLIQKYNALGAVLGTLISEFVVLIIIIVFTREVPFLNMFLKRFPYVSFGIIMCVCVRYTSTYINTNQILKVIVLIFLGAVVYGLECLIYAKVDKTSILSAEYTEIIRRIKG